MRRILWCATLLLMPSVATAATHPLSLTVSADKFDRVQVPVRVPLRLLIEFSKVEAVALHDAAGKKIMGQLTEPGLLDRDFRDLQDAGTTHAHRDLHFILPSLKAGETMTLTGTLSTEAPVKAEGFSWHDTAGEYAELRFGSRPVLRYMYKALDESGKE